MLLEIEEDASNRELVNMVMSPCCTVVNSRDRRLVEITVYEHVISGAACMDDGHKTYGKAEHQGGRYCGKDSPIPEPGSPEHAECGDR